MEYYLALIKLPTGLITYRLVKAENPYKAKIKAKLSYANSRVAIIPTIE